MSHVIQETNRRIAALAAAGVIDRDNREAAHEVIAAQVEAEQDAAQAAISAAAEAKAERSRIAEVVRVGRNCDRPRQALRLALAGPVTAAQAQAILPTLPRDADAPATATALPGQMNFGTDAAKAERARIAAIMGHPEAQGRSKTASAIALEGDEAVPLASALALLSGLPIESTGPRVSPIGLRAEGLAEMGGDYTPMSATNGRAERAAESWKAAAVAANRSMGLAPGSAPAPTVSAGLLPENDPYFGMTPEGRAKAMAEAEKANQA